MVSKGADVTDFSNKKRNEKECENRYDTETGCIEATAVY